MDTLLYLKTKIFINLYYKKETKISDFKKYFYIKSTSWAKSIYLGAGLPKYYCCSVQKKDYFSPH